MSDELKPCPVCGSPAYHFTLGDVTDIEHHIICGNDEGCGFDAHDGSHASKEEVARAWNSRVSSVRQGDGSMSCCMCGSSPRAFDDLNCGKPHWSVRCDGCPAFLDTSHPTKTEALKEWNAIMEKTLER